MSNKCIKDRILSIIDDIEFISKDLFESLITPKHLKQNLGHNIDISQFAELLILKDKSLKECVKEASEQESFEQKIDSLKLEVDKQEEEIKQVQKNLKEAERILATAIYQAKQKLQLIRKANENPILSEELIKYAHKISSSHAVAAPHNWEQGDPRRPYPTDMEMRLGLICQQSGFPVTPSIPDQQNNDQYNVDQYKFFWNTSNSNNNDVKPLNVMNSMNSLIDIKTNGSKDNLEEIEVMSTESSSSSSSDSLN